MILSIGMHVEFMDLMSDGHQLHIHTLFLFLFCLIFVFFFFFCDQCRFLLLRSTLIIVLKLARFQDFSFQDIRVKLCKHAVAIVEI